MFLEILIAIIAGVTAGTFTGLIPGIHVNLITAILVSSTAILSPFFSLFQIVIIIIAMAITHTFVGSIPSILFGAPDESQYLLALPGHKLVLEGKALTAIYLTLVGSYGGLLFSLIAIPLVMFLMKIISETIDGFVGHTLLIAVILLLFFESPSKRFFAALFFLLSGLLGILVFETPNLSQPLLPLLSGLFGTSLLIESLRQKSYFPTQNMSIEKQSLKSSIPLFQLSTIAGFFAAFLPGLGSSQSAIFASKFLRDQTPQKFLLVVSGINTISMSLSLITFYLFDKSRNGAVVGIQELIGSLSLTQLLLSITTLLVAASLSFFIAYKLSVVGVHIVSKISYVKIVSVIICVIILLVFFFDGFVGLLILCTATLLGLSATHKGVAKHYLMGCLLVSTILFFLF